MDLAEIIYEVTASMPRVERYGLISQMRSAVVSVSSNIAEGCGRSSGAELARFLEMASGSASELESQIILACRLRMVDEAVAAELRDHVRRIKTQLYRLRQRVLGRRSRPSPESAAF